jgi:hypothetical protein
VNLPKKTSNLEQDLNSLEDIVRFKPAHDLANITPDFPGHAKGDYEPEKFVAGSILGQVLAVDMNNPDCELD